MSIIFFNILFFYFFHYYLQIRQKKSFILKEVSPHPNVSCWLSLYTDENEKITFDCPTQFVFNALSDPNSECVLNQSPFPSIN